MGQVSPLLRVGGLRLLLGNLWAVNGISFDIRPSGCLLPKGAGPQPATRERGMR